MVASVRSVANRFLDLAEEDDRTVDPLQMQKLVYLGQGWTLGLTGGRLFRESIEAWRYGPVVPDLYHALKVFGDSRIRGRLKAVDERGRLVTATYDDFDQTERRITRNIWEKYGHWAGPRLIALTHVPDGPWHVTRREHPNEIDARIPTSLMRDWFEREAEAARRVNYQDGDGR
jgi:uncharacterized phage-associated protein